MLITFESGPYSLPRPSLPGSNGDAYAARENASASRPGRATGYHCTKHMSTCLLPIFDMLMQNSLVEEGKGPNLGRAHHLQARPSLRSCCWAAETDGPAGPGGSSRALHTHSFPTTTLPRRTKITWPLQHPHRFGRLPICACLCFLLNGGRLAPGPRHRNMGICPTAKKRRSSENEKKNTYHGGSHLPTPHIFFRVHLVGAICCRFRYE